ncbi:hypothetical protein [Pseudoalteromonas marina]|uniref:Uncharacterized protein n=1 Tax=Pseudoalteromonas marina TaxID=267375 RepID=A0ABT9FCE8_9GAMM|nr:hypothetical protein [Pseudoalteromonas marina]MDP2564460.1 hypothetical protein [Pseudoalteromonas marina]
MHVEQSKNVQLGDLVISNANTVPSVEVYGERGPLPSIPNGAVFGWVYEITHDAVRVCYSPYGLMFLGDGFTSMSGGDFALHKQEQLDFVPVPVEMEFNSMASRNPFDAASSYRFKKTVNVWSFDDGSVSEGYDKLSAFELAKLAANFSGFDYKFHAERTFEDVKKVAKHLRMRMTVDKRFKSVSINKLGFHRSFDDANQLDCFVNSHLVGMQLQGNGVVTYALV